MRYHFRVLEEWLPAPTWEGRYEASTHGRIKSLAREGVDKNGRKFPIVERVLRPSPGRYRQVHLADGARRETSYVHDLVLTTFAGPRPEGMECRHLDGDAHNNRIDNLKWGTHSENELDVVKHGNHHLASRDACNYGHLLTGPNLVDDAKSSKQRTCKACKHAKSREDADRRYQEIMDGTYGAPRVTCSPRHLLVEPNLAQWAARRGWLHCLACERARKSVVRAKKHGRQLDAQLEADRHYQKIMGVAASPSWT